MVLPREAVVQRLVRIKYKVRGKHCSRVAKSRHGGFSVDDSRHLTVCKRRPCLVLVVIHNAEETLNEHGLEGQRKHDTRLSFNVQVTLCSAGSHRDILNPVVVETK